MLEFHFPVVGMDGGAYLQGVWYQSPTATVPVLLFLNHTPGSPFGEDTVVLVKNRRRRLLDTQLSESHFL